jgi:hypothetical protein
MFSLLALCFSQSSRLIAAVSSRDDHENYFLSSILTEFFSVALLLYIGGRLGVVLFLFDRLAGCCVELCSGLHAIARIKPR